METKGEGCVTNEQAIAALKCLKRGVVSNDIDAAIEYAIAALTANNPLDGLTDERWLSLYSFLANTDNEATTSWLDNPADGAKTIGAAARQWLREKFE